MNRPFEADDPMRLLDPLAATRRVFRAATRVAHRPVRGLAGALLLAAPAIAGTAWSVDPAAPIEGPSVAPDARLDGPHSGYAARHHRVELRVDGPAGAPLLLLASADASGGESPALDPHAFVVLADGRRDPTARFDGSGVWHGRFPVADGFAIGERLAIEALALEPGGPRRLGATLALEVVDLWTFDAARLTRAGSGWSELADGPLGPWRGRAFGTRGATSGWLDVRVELSAVGAPGRPADAFVVVAPSPWPVDGDALATWVAAAIQRGGWARLAGAGRDDARGARVRAGEARVVGEARMAIETDPSGRWWLVVGTGAGTRELALEHVRVLLRAAR